MRSMFAGVAGLRVHQTKMDVIGNNIANVNTVGFKKSRVNFQEMLNQTMRGASAPQGNMGGVNPMQIGLGVQLGSIDVLHTGGSPQSTGRNLDMSVEGDGYFVVGSGNNRYYTRAGNFDFDEANNLVTVNGMKVFGWTTNPTTLTLDTSAEARAINLGALAETQVQKSTSKIEIGRNLDSRVLPQYTNTNFTGIADTSAIDPLDPQTFIKIKLPQGIVFDKDFAIDGLDYDTLMHPANINKWSINPSTGEIVLKDKDFYVGDIVTNEVQRINLGGASTGAFSLMFDGLETVDIELPSADLVTDIKNALIGLDNIDDGDVNVTLETDGSGNILVNFIGNLSGQNVPELTIDPKPDSDGTPFNGVGADVEDVIIGQTTPDMVSINPDPIISYKEASHQTPLTIYDSLGNAHEANVIYYKSDDNTWLVNVTVNGELVQLNNTPGSEYLHELKFTDKGQITEGQRLPVNLINYNPFGGEAEALEAIIDFSSLTQVATDTSALGLSQDGFAPGSLQSIAVDTSGNIVGTFSNGQNILLAQVALATFRNPAGLLSDGNTLFKESRNSGIAQVGTPGSSGKGIVKPETLEMSNVDLSQEFVEMITTQRGFQANSRIITTSDELLQELVNLKR